MCKVIHACDEGEIFFHAIDVPVIPDGTAFVGGEGVLKYPVDS